MPGELRSVESLVDAVWGGKPPARARPLIHTYVARLRQALEPDRPPRSRTNLIASEPLGYRLALDARQTDVARFDWLVLRAEAACGAGDVEAALRFFSDALRLWRDPWLAELGAALHDCDEIETLRRRWIDVAMRYVGLGLQHGADLAVQPVAEQLVAAEPLNEKAQVRHLSVLVRTGQQLSAIRRYREIRKLLAKELGVEPSAELTSLYRLALRDLAETTDTSVEPMAVRHLNVPIRPQWRGMGPGLGELVHRGDDVEKLVQLLSQHRMVTVTGAPGCGKTALVLHAAAAMLDSFSGGVTVLDVSDAATADELSTRLAAQLDISEDPVTLLGDQHVLLVVDGAELAVEACAEFVDRVVRCCWYVSVIVTSRETLGLPYESVHGLAPLGTPIDDPSVSARSSPATELFVRMATQRQPGFRLGPHNAHAVAYICRRLDGLPLALEAASACLATDSLSALARKVDDPLTQIRPPRRGVSKHHRSLHAALARSLEALTPEEHWVFAQIGRLPRHFAPKDLSPIIARAVDREIDVPQVLARLVGKSLLTIVDEGLAGAKYEMLYTLHCLASTVEPVTVSFAPRGPPKPIARMLQ